MSAKDFRTLAATAAAAERLLGLEPVGSRTALRRQLAGVMREISEMLGNTPAVARKSYVHRRLIDSFRNGELSRLFSGPPMRHMSRGEAAVAGLFAPSPVASRRRGSSRR